MTAVRCCLVIIAGLLSTRTLPAQRLPAAQTVQYDVSAGWFILTPKGNVQTNSNRVDFISDLGMDSAQSQFAFQFAVIPSARSRIFVEFTPYRFSGEETITRSFRFGGVSYNVNERVTSKASLNYVAVGYQREIVNRSRIDFGILGGIGYMGVTAKANAEVAGSAEVTRRLPFPLVGLAARSRPVPDKSRFSIRGNTKGMSFGSLGHYFEGSGAVGFAVSPHITIEPGYFVVDGNGHHTTRGAQFSLRGPTITIRFHDRY